MREVVQQLAGDEVVVRHEAEAWRLMRVSGLMDLEEADRT